MPQFMNDLLIRLHNLREQYDNGSMEALAEIVKLKPQLRLPPMPPLPAIPENFKKDFYLRYPAYCLGLCSATKHISKYLKGCELYKDILEAVELFKSDDVFEIELCCAFEYTRFLSATGHAKGTKVTISTGAFEFLLAKGWDVVKNE